MSLSSPAHAAHAASAAPPLTRIGRFHITRELGRGSIGCVYLGHDPVLGRDVAIKTFNPRLTFSERSRHEHQFLNEARIAGRLSHPHIVTVYDASVENGATYIAMEYLEGRELDKLLDGGHRFKPDEVAAIARRIADALTHAHRRDVVHRDIKPANIFMLDDALPKLVDFGIARAPNRVGGTGEGQDDQHYTLFRHDNLLGTPNYMSPEQACGKPADALSDIYSLGAVMYEMLTGRKPFQADDIDRLLDHIAHKAPPAPHEVDPGIPPALSQIVMKAMSKRPEKRFQSAETMALDLRRHLLRERRARRNGKMGAPAVERRAPEPAAAGRPLSLRPVWLSLAAAAAIAALSLLR